jgi:uncharacterized surface protein with fasciclin (FAS1) repeats
MKSYSIMIKLLNLVLLLIIIVGCKDEEFDKFTRPTWLAGKVYTQIKAEPELSTFARCLELSGFDKIINTSGTYTVFAPSNEAFLKYFQNHPKYRKIEDIPPKELENMVRYQIIKNPWTKTQLRTFDVGGWIDPLSPGNDQPFGYKRETLLFERNNKFGISRNSEGKIIVVDTLNSSWHRTIVTDSRKFIPIFYKEYFDINELKTTDYEYYFGRPFQSTENIYYGNALITSDEIFAENGFVYITDKVVEPLKNAYQILSAQSQQYSYSDFLNLAEQFPNFSYNKVKTFEQQGASEGMIVDSLFDISFPHLTFDICNEKTRSASGNSSNLNITLRYQHGLLAPTNTALKKLEDEFIKVSSGWGSLAKAPDNIKRIILNTHMCINPVYPSNMQNGFINGDGDKVIMSPNSAIQKEYGSNCSFIGLDEAIVPRAFKSVAGPVYLQRGYSTVMYAIEQTGVLPALKKENQNYMFFVRSDNTLNMDSSLIYNPVLKQFSAFDSDKKVVFNTNELRTLLLNHVATRVPTGLPRKEFIPNMGGNYIVVNNVTGEMSGTSPSTYGYNGGVTVKEFPQKISNQQDNGFTYENNNFFNFSTRDIFSTITSQFPKFHNLLKAAGLSLDNEFRYSFISNDNFYTIFIPSNAAIDTFQVGKYTKENLAAILKLHFIQGEVMFTDGKKTPGYYFTTRIDEKSTQFNTLYTRIYIEPGIDQIKFIKKDGSAFLTVQESGNTNLICGIDAGNGNEKIPLNRTSAVIHVLDGFLKKTELNTN